MSVAILIIDIVNDTLKRDTPLSSAILAFLPALNQFLAQARQAGHRIVFSIDSFQEIAPLFQGRMKPYSIEGTKRAEVVSEIMEPRFLILTASEFLAALEKEKE